MYCNQNIKLEVQVRRARDKTILKQKQKKNINNNNKLRYDLFLLYYNRDTTWQVLLIFQFVSVISVCNVHV